MEINIFQDLVCPWCRIGKHNLDQAIRMWDGEPVTVQYRAFMLNPTTPAEGGSLREYLAEKTGGRIPAEHFFEGPRQAGARVGLKFNFEEIEVAPNTLFAHRLIKLVPAEVQPTLIDTLYTAYFEAGRNLGDLDVLVELAGSLDLDQDWVRQQLLTDAGTAEVWADIQLAQELQIRGVPFFIFADRYGLSGAQPPEVVLQVMHEAMGSLAS